MGVVKNEKILAVFLLVSLTVMTSSCSINISVNNDEDKPKEEQNVVRVVEKTVTAEPQPPEKRYTEPKQGVTVKESPFYGVWCGASKNLDEARGYLSELTADGYDAQMYVTTEWTNLNNEKYYVVTAGVCQTKSAAESLLETVKADGYSNAYVKYSGEHK